MAEVHRGRDLRLGRPVAVKLLRADLARDPSFQARFRREAQSAASLNHPNIVAIYDTGEDRFDGDPAGPAQPYIVMELVEGETLRDIVRSGRRLHARSGSPRSAPASWPRSTTATGTASSTATSSPATSC